MSITSNNLTPTLDGSALLRLQGPANSVVSWVIAVGGGAINPINEYTDAQGNAWAVYFPGGHIGPVTIEATYGT